MSRSTWIPIPAETKKRLWVAVLVATGILAACGIVPIVVSPFKGAIEEAVSIGAILAALVTR